MRKALQAAPGRLLRAWSGEMEGEGYPLPGRVFQPPVGRFSARAARSPP
jgi:hypothetical protein